MTPKHVWPGVLLGILLVSGPGWACPPRPDRWGPAVPDFAEVKLGGYSGLIAAGAGYSGANDVIHVAGLYGFTPATIAGTDIQTVLIALSGRVPAVCPVRKLSWVPAYLGVGGLFAWGEGFFLRSPARYPAGYYDLPTGVRLLGFAGTEASLTYEPDEPAHGLFWEVVVVDQLFWAWLQNQRTISFWDVAGSAVGYRIRF